MRIFARGYILGPGRSVEALKQEMSAANPGSVVQAVRAEAADNEALLEMIAAQTFRAKASGGLLAKKPEIDLLLRLAGTTQISEAIGRIGAEGGEESLLVVAGLGEVKEPRGREWKALPRRGLSKKDLEKVERSALLNTRRL